MKNVLIFSGTTEGRRLAETLVKNGIFCHVCVATEYGVQVMESSELMQVHMGRLDVDAMKELYADIRPDVVIDAIPSFCKDRFGKHKRESAKPWDSLCASGATAGCGGRLWKGRSLCGQSGGLSGTALARQWEYFAYDRK